MTIPSISIVIPTYNSERVLPLVLKGIKSQRISKDKFEVIVVDLESKDETKKLALEFGARYYSVKGKPSKACTQRNLGISKSRGEFALILDHDMEISLNLLKNFLIKAKKNPEIDAWYIPEKIYASSTWLTKVRNFERGFYNATIIDAARIVRKKSFLKTPDKYDPRLDPGPADWDFDIQLRKMGCKFGILPDCLYHHEEHLSFSRYISKKGFYAEGIERYKNKWKKSDPTIFRNTVQNQFSIFYRTIGVFFENGKWREVIRHPLLYLNVLAIKSLMLYVIVKENTFPLDSRLSRV